MSSYIRSASDLLLSIVHFGYPHLGIQIDDLLSIDTFLYISLKGKFLNSHKYCLSFKNLRIILVLILHFCSIIHHYRFYFFSCISCKISFNHNPIIITSVLRKYWCNFLVLIFSFSKNN